MNIIKKIKLFRKKNLIIIGIILILTIFYIIIENTVDKNFDNIITNENEESDEIEINEKSNDNTEVKDDNNKITSEIDVDIEEDNEKVVEDKEEKIYVYITGEVNNPGVKELKNGSRIVDAIEAAGGITSKANIKKINLAYTLKDGMKINIPSDEDIDNSNFEYITMNSGDEKNDSNLTKSNENNLGGDTAFKISIVNINTATQTELETLPGIGPSLALKIIDYRKENGKFTSIEDLKNVSGIGESKFENIRKYIIV